MAQIALVKRHEKQMEEAQLVVVRKFLFDVIDGAHTEDKKAWRRFWKKMIDLPMGEIAKVEFLFPRNGRFHRKFFAMLDFAFDAWEPNRKHKTYRGVAVEKNREQFRKEVIILAGYSTQTFHLDGSFVLSAKSISFANMDELEFEALYSSVVNVILEKVLTNYSGRDELDYVLENLTGFL